MADQEAAEKLYPCKFPIKVIGENSDRLGEVIIEVMAGLDEVIDPGELVYTLSKNGKYRSITFTIIALGRAHIEKVYSALGAQKEVKLVM
jgi:uncharacterized protein